MTGADSTGGTTPTPKELRAELEAMIVADLRGPVGGPEEQLPGIRPVHDHYLLGMLAPAGTIATDVARTEDPGVDGEETQGGVGDEPTSATSLFPSSIGLSFALDAGVDTLEVTASWGRYTKTTATAATEDVSGDPGAAAEAPEAKPVWQREPVSAEVGVDISRDGPIEHPDIVADVPGVGIRGRCSTSATGIRLVTLFLVNEQSPAGKVNRDRWWLFQPELAVAVPGGADGFMGRLDALDRPERDDPESAGLDLLYRRQVEYATGHGTAVHAEVDPARPWRATRLTTVVAPTYEVAKVEAPTPAEVPAIAGVTLDMKVLSEAADADLPRLLTPLADAYVEWLDDQEARIGEADERLAGREDVARTQVEQARDVADRLRGGIDLLGTDADAAEAFRFANAAMWQQRVHTIAATARRVDPALALSDAVADADVARNRSWRPFQLAFVCLNLPSLTDPTHAERGTPGLVDLLFFPTGGGKTEAYLGLTAFTLAIRRLQGTVSGHDGSEGVAVLMRYTLRLLTAQQFQRATALICACELLRREHAAAGDSRWDASPMRIGMWVGSSVTPNRNKYAQQALADMRSTWGAKAKGASPVQLASCPWCGTEIDPARHAHSDPDRWRTLLYCGDPLGTCPFTEAGSPGEGLPVVTVDEELYRLLPSLVIATADKFAQLPWQGPLHLLFGRVEKRCTRHGFRSPDLDNYGGHEERDSHKRTAHLPPAQTVACAPLRPPDLIIQDELHLIAGPLGSLVGLAETAVDALCTWDCDGTAVRPKVVASTATIRRAEHQVYQLFWRKLAVFPPPVLDADDSFFARSRPTGETPGRRYLGICARGTALKTVETRVFTTALAAAQRLAELHGAAADPWMTCVAYFNALRELGGARRIVDDDVTNRLKRTDRKGLARRTRLAVRELTSRIASPEIPEILDHLGVAYVPEDERGDDTPPPIDILLATNMISVGVDVARLGLMVAVGQPKTTAEYIQATSRVGRDRAGPGLVLTIYNWARPRDLSHYEAFEHYHATFYRHVEALSVTPFAPRALDRGLTAAFTAMARQHNLDWNPDTAADTVDTTDGRLGTIITSIAERAAQLGDGPATGALVADMLAARRDEWAARRQGEAHLAYRGGRGDTVPLLAEPTAQDWNVWTCPTSMREVEPTVNLILRPIDASLNAAPPWSGAHSPAALEVTEDDVAAETEDDAS